MTVVLWLSKRTTSRFDHFAQPITLVLLLNGFVWSWIAAVLVLASVSVLIDLAAKRWQSA